MAVPELLTLWTIQEMDAWALARSRGVLRGDGRRVWTEHRPSYRWMRRQMKQRLPDYRGGFPIWAWTDRPDLRQAAHLPTGTWGVLLRFRTAAMRALLSRFDAWHTCLNDGYLALDESDPAEIAWKKLYPQRPPPPEGVPAMERSWDLIFELELFQKHPDWLDEKPQIQAVIEAVPVTAVEQVVTFRARQLHGYDRESHRALRFTLSQWF